MVLPGVADGRFFKKRNNCAACQKIKWTEDNFLGYTLSKKLEHSDFTGLKYMEYRKRVVNFRAPL
jgi:hypothetical protein